MIIRDVTLEDTEELLKIYAPYVLNTAVSFEYTVPTAEEFAGRIEEITKKFPYLAAIEDGRIVGYCYAHAFHPRKAYEWCVETSIYLDMDSRRKGTGRLLYEELEKRLKVMGIKNLYACIAYPPKMNDEFLSKDSIIFHEKMGYVQCAHLRECGYKFNRWYDMMYYEKIIGDKNETVKY